MVEAAGAHPAFMLRNPGKTPYDLGPFIATSTFTASTDAVTEISTTIEDTDLRRLRSGVLTIDRTLVDWEGIHKMVLAAIEANPGASGRGGLRLDWRSWWVRNLKHRRGPHVLRNVSATQYVQAECRAIGLKAVFAQPTARRTQIARDVPAADSPPEEGANYPSAWTTLQRLAREEGFIVFEYGSSLYFGRPSWVRARRLEQNIAGWQNMRSDRDRALRHPTCRRSMDSATLVEVDVDWPWAERHRFRPGWSLDLRGVPGFDGAYMVKSVSWDLTKTTGVATINAQSAIDPRPELAQAATSTERGIGKYKFIVDAAIRAGFKGASLLTAVAVALAESGGNPKAVGPPNKVGAARGSRDHGLWQINDYYHQFDRILIYDPYYNAVMAFKISNSGTTWTPWSVYKSGAYRKYLDMARASIEVSQSLTPNTQLDGGGVVAPGKPNPAREAELSRNAIIVRRAVVARFGEMTIHGWGLRDNVTEHDDRDPRTGRKAANALDFMVFSDFAKGQRIADFIYTAATNGTLPVDYLIWNRRINSFDRRGWRRYTGRNPHIDHPHVTVNR